jgi:hypothetical protein
MLWSERVCRVVSIHSLTSTCSATETTWQTKNKKNILYYPGGCCGVRGCAECCPYTHWPVHALQLRQPGKQKKTKNILHYLGGCCGVRGCAECCPYTHWPAHALQLRQPGKQKNKKISCTTQEDAVEWEGVQSGVHTLTDQRMLCNWDNLANKKNKKISCTTQGDAVEWEGVQSGVHTLTHQHMLCNWDNLAHKKQSIHSLTSTCSTIETTWQKKKNRKYLQTSCNGAPFCWM